VFGEKNATKILEALQRAKTAPLSRWIMALAINDVGEATARELAKLHRDLDDLANSKLLQHIAHTGKESLVLQKEIERILSINSSLKVEAENQKKNLESEIARLKNDLEKSEISSKQRTSLKNKIKTRESRLPLAGLSEEIGPVVAKSIINFFSAAYGKNILKRLGELKIHPVGNIGTQKATANAAPFLGKTFVLTGTLPSLSRDEAAALIRDAGGNVTGSVSKNTDFLLTGEEGGSKLNKANELGIKIISEADFLKLLGASKKWEKATEKTNQSELF
jgi:DNA ligase (NAD+)